MHHAVPSHGDNNHATTHLPVFVNFVPLVLHVAPLFRFLLSLPLELCNAELQLVHVRSFVPTATASTALFRLLQG